MSRPITVVELPALSRALALLCQCGLGLPVIVQRVHPSARARRSLAAE